MTFSVNEATVRFGDVTALDEVTVLVEPGQVVAVVGGDGAGKTTLLRAIVGEVVLDAGWVVAPEPQSIGYLPATAGSWLELTVAENMDFVGGIYGLRGQDLAQRRRRLLTRAGLESVRDRLSGRLSGGMRRKLGFSMAMVHDPPMLVLDEPSTGVDPVSRVDLWRLVSQAAAAGAAVIMSTTYLDEAERAEYLVVLDQGRAVVQGAPTDVVAGFQGVIRRTAVPTRRDWAWRRGRFFHELQDDASPAGEGEPAAPDLEDVVIATSLVNRAASRPVVAS
jgi:ABC-2 type transport system ATP-binding protein